MGPGIGKDSFRLLQHHRHQGPLQERFESVKRSKAMDDWMKIIDLSDPIVELNEIAKIESHGWNEKRLSMNSHSSTHIDAPFHMIENGKKLSEYSLDRFYGDGIVIKAVGKKTLGKELLKGKEIKGKIV